MNFVLVHVQYISKITGKHQISFMTKPKAYYTYVIQSQLKWSCQANNSLKFVSDATGTVVNMRPVEKERHNQLTILKLLWLHLPHYPKQLNVHPWCTLAKNINKKYLPQIVTTALHLQRRCTVYMSTTILSRKGHSDTQIKDTLVKKGHPDVP